MPQHTSVKGMAPPPTPIDPSLESFHASPAPNLALDQLVLTSPGPPSRPYYPKEIHLAANFFQEGQPPLMRPSQLDLIPSLNSHPDPWDSQRINGRMAQPQLMNQNYTDARERSRQNAPPTFWDTHTTRSDLDSSTGRHVPDSGYYTQTQGTRSVFSADLAGNSECQSLTGGMAETEFSRDEMQYGTIYHSEPCVDGPSNFAEEHHEENPLELICQICQSKSKNKSEFTYVVFSYFLEAFPTKQTPVGSISFVMRNLSNATWKAVAESRKGLRPRMI